MTFTATTIRKLRALNLPQETFDRILEIFEEARESRPKKKGSADDRRQRGTRLPDDWGLPKEWHDWALELGLRKSEIDREAVKFRNYWLNAAGAKGVKLRWDLTWQTWCEKALQYLGREPAAPKAIGGAGGGGASGAVRFDDKTWQAIARRYKSTGQWNPEWGPGPDRMDCQMPEKYL